MTVDIGAILGDGDRLQAAYVDLRTLSEIAQQRGMDGVEPDAYGGPVYSPEEGRRIVEAYGASTGNDKSVSRVSAFWESSQPVVSEIYIENDS